MIAGWYIQGTGKVCLPLSVIRSINQVTIAYYEHTVSLQNYGEIYIQYKMFSREYETYKYDT